MSRLKRIAVSTTVSLMVLSGATALWYQSHYVAPFAPPPPQALPSPNGYDTLQQAIKLLVRSEYGPSPYTGLNLAARQIVLADNKDCLAKTREALRQEYLIPRSVVVNPALYSDHQYLMLDAVATHASAGDQAEAIQCALDAIELGIVLPRGGDFTTREIGHQYEASAHRVIWPMVDHIDATVARRAVERLEKMEERRWPLAENLRENLRLRNLPYDLANFKRGPVFVWEKMGLSGTEKASPTTLQKQAEALWNRTKAVYYGPKVVLDSSQESVRVLQEQSQLPWKQHRSKPDQHSQYGLYNYPYEEFVDFFFRTESVLLRTRLALRAYNLERGGYPESLEELVSAGYLKAMPVDPFSPTRARLRYQPDGMLWSIGPDAKDDGGKSIVPDSWNHVARSAAGDITSRCPTDTRLSHLRHSHQRLKVL